VAYQTGKKMKYSGWLATRQQTQQAVLWAAHPTDWRTGGLRACGLAEPNWWWLLATSGKAKRTGVAAGNEWRTMGMWTNPTIKRRRVASECRGVPINQKERKK